MGAGVTRDASAHSLPFFFLVALWRRRKREAGGERMRRGRGRGGHDTKRGRGGEAVAAAATTTARRPRLTERRGPLICEYGGQQRGEELISSISSTHTPTSIAAAATDLRSLPLPHLPPFWPTPLAQLSRTSAVPLSLIPVPGASSRHRSAFHVLAPRGNLTGIMGGGRFDWGEGEGGRELSKQHWKKKTK